MCGVQHCGNADVAHAAATTLLRNYFVPEKLLIGPFLDCFKVNLEIVPKSLEISLLIQRLDSFGG